MHDHTHAEFEDYDLSYDIVREAMKLLSSEEPKERLQKLKNALYVASVFVNEELAELPDEATELGLDKWQEEEAEAIKEMEELEKELTEANACEIAESRECPG